MSSSSVKGMPKAPVIVRSWASSIFFSSSARHLNRSSLSTLRNSQKSGRSRKPCLLHSRVRVMATNARPMVATGFVLGWCAKSTTAPSSKVSPWLLWIVTPQARTSGSWSLSQSFLRLWRLGTGAMGTHVGWSGYTTGPVYFGISTTT